MNISPNVSTGNLTLLQNHNPTVPLQFKVGHYVTGTVRRVLGNNRVLTQIQGQTLVASAQISVNVGETLLMQVSSVRPKPKLRVIDPLKKGDIKGKDRTNSLFRQLSDLEIPVSPSLFGLLFGEEIGQAEVEEILGAFDRAPKFWRRLLWHAVFSSFSQLQQVGQFINAGDNLFSHEFMQQFLSVLPAKFHMNSFGDLLEFLQNFPGQSGHANDYSAGSVNIWELLRNLFWESGHWLGDMFPLHFGKEKGVAGFSFWKPEQSDESELPVRLTILAVFRNDWKLHAVIEFRQQDLAGVIDVNSPGFRKRLNGHIPVSREQLHSHGFTNVHIRVNYIAGMNLELSKLLPPPVHTVNFYTG